MQLTESDVIAIWRQLTRIDHYFFTMASKQQTCAHADIPITLAQLKLLAILTDHLPEAMKLKDLAGELQLTPGAVSQMVDALCHLGFIERRQDDADRRSIAITMSCDGQQGLEHFHAAVSAQLMPFLTDIPPEKLSVFMEVLATLSGRTFQPPENEQTH